MTAASTGTSSARATATSASPGSRRCGYVGFGDAIEVEDVTTPADWQRRGMDAGAPFAAAHSFFQTGPFRPANLAPKVEGVVFAGSGTQPGRRRADGAGLGRLAAERILGKDQGYRSRAQRLAL